MADGFQGMSLAQVLWPARLNRYCWQSRIVPIISPLWGRYRSGSGSRRRLLPPSLPRDCWHHWHGNRVSCSRSPDWSGVCISRSSVQVCGGKGEDGRIDTARRRKVRQTKMWLNNHNSRLATTGGVVKSRRHPINFTLYPRTLALPCSPETIGSGGARSQFEVFVQKPVGHVRCTQCEISVSASRKVHGERRRSPVAR